MRSIALLAMAVAGPAAAQEWEGRITPYIWGPSFDVDTIIDRQNAGSSGGVTDWLDGAFFINGELRRGRLTFFGEYNYLSLSDEVLPRFKLIDADLELWGWMGAIGAGWAVVDTGTTRVDLGGGVRHWDIKAKIDFKKLNDPSTEVTITDPIIALRATHQIGERWELAGDGNIGGFGVGSELQVDLNVRASYAMGERWAVVGGYRYLDVNLGDDKAIRDLSLIGPYLALDFRF